MGCGGARGSWAQPSKVTALATPLEAPGLRLQPHPGVALASVGLKGAGDRVTGGLTLGGLMCKLPRGVSVSNGWGHAWIIRPKFTLSCLSFGPGASHQFPKRKWGQVSPA